MWVCNRAASEIEPRPTAWVVVVVVGRSVVVGRLVRQFQTVDRMVGELVGRSVGCSQNSLTCWEGASAKERPQVKRGSAHTRTASTLARTIDDAEEERSRALSDSVEEAQDRLVECGRSFQ